MNRPLWFLAAALVLFAPAPSGAEVPLGQPPPRPAPSARGLTINAEVLTRYGYSLEKYQDMTPSERDRVSEWIEILEGDRLAAKARAAVAAPSAPNKAKPGLGPKDLEGLGRIKAETLFDNNRAAAGGVGGPSPWRLDLRTKDGDFSRFTLRDDPRDLELSFGDLGAGPGSGLLGESPYVNVTKGGSHSGKWLDSSYKAQAGVVAMRARLFPNDAPALDARIDRNLPGLGRDAAALQRSSRVDPGHIQETLFVGSAYGQFGRGYHLIGPVDFVWSSMGLATVTGMLPNIVLDQSAGLRLALPKDNNIGLFGGLTEGAALFSRTLVAEAVETGKTDMTPGVDLAPHATVAAWGKLPYFSSVDYSVEAGRQWNPWTTVQTVGGALTTSAGGASRVGVHGSWSEESGPAAEFERTKASAGIGYSPNKNVDLSADLVRDRARLGNAEIDRNSVILGLTVRDSPPGSPTSSFQSSVAGPEQINLPGIDASVFARALQEQFDKLLALKALAESYAGPGGTQARWADLQEAWRTLDPAVRADIDEQYREQVPGGPPLDSLFSLSPAKVDLVLRLGDVLADVAMLDRLLTRAIRSQIVANLDKLEVPLFGRKIKMTAPMVLAAAHAYSLGLRPMPAVTEFDARNSLDPAVLKNIQGLLGCPKGAASAVTDCLLAKLPAAEAEALRQAHGADLTRLLQEAVRWASDVLRREINAMLLRIMLSAERFNEMTVHGGERIGTLNTAAMRRSLALLKERDRRLPKQVFERAALRLQSDLAAQDEALRERLIEYGRSRLAWLQSQPAWPAGVQIAVRPGHWARLLALYGDAGLFDIILRAKAKLAREGGQPARLLLELNDNALLPGLMIQRGDPTVISLPARPPKRPLELEL